MANSSIQPSPENIMQIGTGFWASKILLSAVKFQLFTLLAENNSMSAQQIKSALNLQCTNRNVYDFLDALTAFHFLNREGLLETARYSNSNDTAIFLDKNKPSYIGGILEMLNNRLYNNWGNLEAGFLTGHSQNKAANGKEDPFESLYATPEKLKEFINAMSGIQMGNFIAFAQKFDFSKYKTLTDAGGSSGLLSCMVARYQPHMSCISFDLPAVESIARENLFCLESADRVKLMSGNFFTGTIPAADVVVMGNILHDWDEQLKMKLMEKAFEAIPDGGAFVAIENIIDDDRKQNAFGLMMSINMLVETGKGFDYTFADFSKWAEKVGFKSTALLPLAGPASAAIAYK
jgi:precorrin-6B methylase 2